MCSFISSLSGTPIVAPVANQPKVVSEYQKEMFRLGRDQYNQSFKTSLGFFLEALNNQFGGMGISGTAEDQLLLTTNIDSVMEKCVHMTQEQRLFLATCLRWAGHCYQNIDEFSCAGNQNDTRFNFLYGLAEKILLSSLYDESSAIILFAQEDKAVKKELVELYYNTSVFMHLRANPGKFVEAGRKLDKVLELEKTPSMLARVCNQRSSLKNRAGIAETADDYCREVLMPYKTLCDSDPTLSPPDKDPFLLPLYSHNYAKLLLAEGSRLAEADQALQVTVAYMEDKEKTNYHAYFPMFYQTLAKIKWIQGKTDEALAAEAKSAEHASRNPGSYTVQLKK